MVVVANQIRDPECLREHEYKRYGHKTEDFELDPGFLRIIVCHENIEQARSNEKQNPNDIQFVPLSARNLAEWHPLDQAEKALHERPVSHPEAAEKRNGYHPVKSRRLPVKKQGISEIQSQCASNQEKHSGPEIHLVECLGADVFDDQADWHCDHQDDQREIDTFINEGAEKQYERKEFEK
jgi:hypothetical protein